MIVSYLLNEKSWSFALHKLCKELNFRNIVRLKFILSCYYYCYISHAIELKAAELETLTGASVQMRIKNQDSGTVSTYKSPKEKDFLPASTTTKKKDVATEACVSFSSKHTQTEFDPPKITHSKVKCQLCSSTGMTGNSDGFCLGCGRRDCTIGSVADA